MTSKIIENAIGQIRHLTPTLLPGSKVYFRDLPDNYKGAWIFRDGIQYFPRLVLQRDDLYFSKIYEENIRTDPKSNIYVFNYINGYLQLEPANKDYLK
jgi:hypothetical protein